MIDSGATVFLNNSYKTYKIKLKFVCAMRPIDSIIIY